MGRLEWRDRITASRVSWANWPEGSSKGSIIGMSMIEVAYGVVRELCSS